MTGQPSVVEEKVAFDPRGFRHALGTFPTGVTIISTNDANGEPVGLTANSFSSVSLDPPLVLFSLARRSPSLSAFEQNGFFAVNVLASDQGDLSNKFATSSADKWRGVHFKIGASGGSPLIANALASFECRLHALLDGGDHVILVGRVLRFERMVTAEPLVFCRGSYRVLADADAFADFGMSNEPRVLPPLNGFDPWTAG